MLRASQRQSLCLISSWRICLCCISEDVVFCLFAFYVFVAIYRRKFYSFFSNETELFDQGCVLTGSKKASDSGSDLAGKSQACTSHLCSTGNITWQAPKELLCQRSLLLCAAQPASDSTSQSMGDRTLSWPGLLSKCWKWWPS